MHHIHRAALVAATTAVLVALSALAAFAFPVEGRMRTGEGGPVADGDYVLTIGLYDSADAKVPLWQEIHIGVPVQQGFFSLQAGEAQLGNPLPEGLFVDHPDVWFGLTVGKEPPMERQRLHALPYAIVAEAARSLACTGCVKAAQIDPGVFADYAKTADLAKVATSGKFADLDGGPVLTGYARTDTTNIFQKPQIMAGGLGIAKGPAPGCGLDLGTDGGGACVDGSKAVWPRVVENAAAMGKVAIPGQFVYRADTGQAYLFVGNGWRKVVLEIVCGDGWINPPEQCDDGESNADKADACRLNCTKPACGDLIVDTGEACDDGNGSPTDACVLCKLAVCGDSFVQAGVEACDDGNNSSADACIACKAATCGDGYLHIGVEECDNGNQNADVADACRTSCKTAKCGDNILDTGEACDDGNTQSGDGCSDKCVIDVKVDVTFTTCGGSGLSGPNQSQCNGAYGGGGLAGKVTVASGVQAWTVPATGAYRITTFGAQGGNDPYTWPGGLGAKMAGVFTLQQGATLRIIVGHQGMPVKGNGNAANGGAGGGGGTFVWIDGQGQPLIAAGAGGGSCLQNSGEAACHGKVGVTSTNGSNAPSGNNAGQNGGDSTCVNGGRGWNTVKNSPNGTNTSGYNDGGGFGGGSGGGQNCGGNYGHVAGGGGGYSGGGGGTSSYQYAGGGGSFNGGSDQSNQAGARTGHGQVQITLL